MTHLEKLEQKILPMEKLPSTLACHRFLQEKIVFTNGCFDLLHRGHIDYLSKAADQGNVLLIGLNTDASVKRLKGKNRPLNDEYSRALALAALRFTSWIVLFEEDTPLELIQKVKPDVLVKGADYSVQNIVGADFVSSYGGEVKTIPLTDGFSTTDLINRL